MLYLAQIEKSKLARRIKLIAIRQDSGFWVPLPVMDDAPLPANYQHLADQILVFLQLDHRQRVLELKNAVTEIIGFLNNMSSSVERLAQEQSEIQLWRNSLHCQIEDLFVRSQLIEAREVELGLRGCGE